MLITIPSGLFSQNSDTTLFLTSTPLNCHIKVNSRSLRDKTPLLLKDLREGEYSIEISKDGFNTVIKKISVREGTIVRKSVSLSRILSQKDTEGSKVYPQQKYIDSLNIVIPVLSGFTAALTVNEISNPRYSDALLSPFVISTYIVNTLFIGADIALHMHKNSFQNKYNFQNTESIKTNTVYSFQQGNKAFREGEFAKALSFYRKVIDTDKNHRLYPKALYKSAVIHFIQNNYKDASSGFREIIKDYPEAELYDNALKNLAEIYIREKKYKKAVILLEDIIYVNNLYTREEIASRISEISALKGQTD